MTRVYTFMIPIHFQACHSFHFWWFFSLPNIAKKHKLVATCWKCRNISSGRQCHINLSELAFTNELSNKWQHKKENSSNIANTYCSSLSCLCNLLPTLQISTEYILIPLFISIQWYVWFHTRDVQDLLWYLIAMN